TLLAAGETRQPPLPPPHLPAHQVLAEESVVLGRLLPAGNSPMAVSGGSLGCPAWTAIPRTAHSARGCPRRRIASSGHWLGARPRRQAAAAATRVMWRGWWRRWR